MDRDTKIVIGIIMLVFLLVGFYGGRYYEKDRICDSIDNASVHCNAMRANGPGPSPQ